MPRHLTLALALAPLAIATPSFADYTDRYDRVPDTATCDAGELKEAEKLEALARLNEIRALSGLPAVAYQTQDDNLTAQAALIIAANGSLSHYPSQASYCWSQDGYDGSSTSNIALSQASYALERTSADFVDLWLIDNNVESLGHRRWLLDPFLKYVSFGRVDGTLLSGDWNFAIGAALKVINSEYADISSWQGEYVAYPHGNYPPALFNTGWYASFSAIADNVSFWNNSQVDYASATISVQNPEGIALNVHSISYNNQGYGLPNHIQWKTDDLQENITYTVTIANVTVNSQSKDYSYTFTLTDETLSPTGSIVVTEFRNVSTNHYFITASSDEAEAIDQGSAGPDWVRTGLTFRGWLPGQVPEDAKEVCRFWSTPYLSHFYTFVGNECETVKTNPFWSYEPASIFYMKEPNANQTCDEGYDPVYRLYNNRHEENDGNHRYTIDLQVYDRMETEGWAKEGVRFCSPSQ